MKFALPKLPFAPNDLNPAISAETIEYHYGKHHKAYVDKTNELIQGTRFANLSLEEIVEEAEGTLYNNASQAWNHTFYWNCLAPGQKVVEPTGALLDALKKDFGSVDAFKKEFIEASKSLFGSGWTWLVKDPTGKLEILALPNADSPVGHDSIPLLTCDVWEHAYYIDYRNERPKYLEAYFKILNWDFALGNFALDENPDMTSLMIGGTNAGLTQDSKNAVKPSSDSRLII